MKCSCNWNKIKETKMFQGIFTVSLQNYFFFTEYARLLYKIVLHCFNGSYVVLLAFSPLLFDAYVGEKKSVQRCLEVCLSVVSFQYFLSQAYRGTCFSPFAFVAGASNRRLFQSSSHPLNFCAHLFSFL